MKFDIVTIFPSIFDSYFNESILGRAQRQGAIRIKAHDLRDFSENRQKKVVLRHGLGLSSAKRLQDSFSPRQKIDDTPYGGGVGMILQALPILRAVSSILKRVSGRTKIVIFSAKGKQLNQNMVYDWANNYKNMILISGRYEGTDERAKIILKQIARDKARNVSVEEVAIGPYVLTDGDIPVMAVVSAVSRLVPGVINWKSLQDESFGNKLFKKEKFAEDSRHVEYPHYTRPEIIEWPPRSKGKRAKKYRVPKVLLGGNHKKIDEWRSARKK